MEEESNWEGGGGGEQILIVGHQGGSGGHPDLRLLKELCISV